MLELIATTAIVAMFAFMVFAVATGFTKKR